MGDDEKLNNEMEEEEEGGAGAAAGGAAGSAMSKIIKILMWVVGVVLLAAVMFGIAYIVANYVEERRAQRDEGVLIAPPPPPRSSFDMATFSITTRDEEPHFAKITIQLGYEESPEFLSELTKRKVEMRHIINMLLSSKKYEDMDTLEKKISLSEEIKSHLNVVLSGGKIVDVYFTEFIVNF